MINIRRDTFETNSSSTHSLVMPQDKEILFKVSRIDFKIGKFGFKQQKLNTLDEKSSYLYTAILDCFGKEICNQYIENLKIVLKENNIDYTFEEPIWNQSGRLENGFIDHSENLKNFVIYTLSDIVILFCYLLNDRTFIVTSNDSMFEEYNKEILEEINYKCESKLINGSDM